MNKYLKNLRFSVLSLFSVILFLASLAEAGTQKPNIVLVMTDDQGWGQTGYYNHPVLKTPNLDAMAANGLRFDRFYAGAPVCSPTRASVLTGRANDRTGVPNHGYALRLQEKNLAQALKDAGYATGHFGKWHLNALRGPGVPILGDDSHSPGVFGFDEWLTVTNFFDVNPIMSREGEFKEFKGESSEIIVDEALKFISRKVDEEKPFFTVVWYGSPHGPWVASEEDRSDFDGLDEKSQHHYGELVAVDRSIGTLRGKLRELGVAENTLVWFCSDNGGLRNPKPDTVGGLRGYKGSVYEGGLRVPGIIEWPSSVDPRISDYPASTMDIFPTIAELLELPESVFLDTVDGRSLTAVLDNEPDVRAEPIPFRFRGAGALVDNNYKLVTQNIEKGVYELFDLEKDLKETTDISKSRPEVFEKMKAYFIDWNKTVDASVAGKDYPEGRVNGGEPESGFWMVDERYEPFLEDWKIRPEYKGRFEK